MPAILPARVILAKVEKKFSGGTAWSAVLTMHGIMMPWRATADKRHEPDVGRLEPPQSECQRFPISRTTYTTLGTTSIWIMQLLVASLVASWQLSAGTSGAK